MTPKNKYEELIMEMGFLESRITRLERRNVASKERELNLQKRLEELEALRNDA